MDAGIIFSTFIVVFREALEAGLIIGIILTVLARLNAKKYYSHVIISSVVAMILSYFVGVWLYGLTQASQETWAPAIEGGISLLAAAVLTYMCFWMNRQSRSIKPEMEAKIQIALSDQDHLAMVSLPFFAVFREGAETVLFLKAVSLQSGQSVSWAGGSAGLALALLIVVLIFAGGKKIPLKMLFRYTGVLILFIAAGLLAYGVHELNEIGWIPSGIYPVYNINHILNDKEGVGSFLKALFGYNGNPSLTEVMAYWAYLTWMYFALFYKKDKKNV